MSNEDLALAGLAVLCIVAMKYQEKLNYIASGEWLQPVYSVFSYWPLALFVIANIAGLSLVLVGAARAVKGVFSFRRDLANLHADLSALNEESSTLKDDLGKARTENTSLSTRLSRSSRVMREQLEEIERLKEMKVERPEDYVINAREDTPLYKAKDLNDAEERYLLRHGFTKHKFVGIHSPGPQVWLLKGSSHESPEHFFLVHQIADYLRPRAVKVELFETRGPDIVFTTLEGKKVALEIETGSWLRSDRKGFKKKVAQLEEAYGQDWAIVVAHSDLRKKYRSYGPTYTKGQVKAWLTQHFA